MHINLTMIIFKMTDARVKKLHDLARDGYNTLTIWGSGSIEVTSLEQAVKEFDMLRKLVEWEAVNDIYYNIGASPDNTPESERFGGGGTGGGIDKGDLYPSKNERPTFYDDVLKALHKGERVWYNGGFAVLHK